MARNSRPTGQGRVVIPRLSLDPVQVRRGNVPGRSPFGPRRFADGETTPQDEAAPIPAARRVQHAIPPEYVGDPVHLTASVTGLNAGSSGGGVNVKALKNPGPGPIEIFGIKFRLAASQPITGALVGCRLDLGEFQLTQGYVPVYAFGRAENLIAEQTADGANPPVRAFSEYICRLREPIFLPAGAAIRPQLQHKGLTNASVDVHISMFGRMLSPDTPLPKKLRLPFWASYVCKSFAVGTADTDNSTENDLVNPFDVPLEMERFVGRMSYFSGSGLRFATSMAEVENSNYAPSVTPQASTIGDLLGQVTCSIIDSNGYPVVKRLTPFRLVFDAETRSWPVTHELSPGGYYLVSMSNSAWIVAAAVSGLFVQPCISMLGWREVA